MQIATDVGFAPPVLVKSSIITCEDPELKKMAGRQCLSSSLSYSSVPSSSSPCFMFSSYPSFSTLLLHLHYSFTPPPLTFSLSPPIFCPCSSLTSSFTTTTTSSINLAIIIPHPQSLQGVFSFALQPTV